MNEAKRTCLWDVFKALLAVAIFAAFFWVLVGFVKPEVHTEIDKPIYIYGGETLKIISDGHVNMVATSNYFFRLLSNSDQITADPKPNELRLATQPAYYKDTPIGNSEWILFTEPGLQKVGFLFSSPSSITITIYRSVKEVGGAIIILLVAGLLLWALIIGLIYLIKVGASYAHKRYVDAFKNAPKLDPME
jgi:hypothetical protein